MARQENFNLFALLGDGAEDSDDVSTLIENVVKVDPRVAAEEKRRKKKKKKNMEAEKPIGINLDVDSNNYKNNNNIVVDMRAKRIVLPEYVTRRDIVVNKKQSDEQGQSLGSERFGPGGNGSQRNYGGADGYQRKNGGRNGYQRSNRGSDGYQPNNGGADGYQRNNGGRYNGGADGYQSNNGGRTGYQRSNRGSDGYQPNNEGGSGYNGNNGGENSFQRTEGADAVNAVGDGWQVQGRVRVSRGRGRGGGGRGRGRGRGRGFNEGHEFGSENQDVVSSYPLDKPGQDTNDGGSVEQNEFQGKVRESEAQSDERPRNVNRGTGGGRRGNGRGNHGFRGQDSRPYDRQSGPNNRRGEVSNDTEAKENHGGDIGTAVQVDNSAGAEWDIPVTTEEPKDAEHEQGKLKAQDNSEKKAKHADDDEEEKNMTLEEYEKVRFEKRKALESLRKTEQRTVTLDKDFESMQLVEKKKDDSLVIKPKSEEKLKKKNSLEKDDKARKLMNINEFLKPPARGGRGRGRGRERGGQGEFRGERGSRGEFRGERGGRGEFLGLRPQVEDVPAPSIEDPQQFPVLGGAIKA